MDHEVLLVVEDPLLYYHTLNWDLLVVDQKMIEVLLERLVDQ